MHNNIKSLSINNKIKNILFFLIKSICTSWKSVGYVKLTLYDKLYLDL